MVQILKLRHDEGEEEEEWHKQIKTKCARRENSKEGKQEGKRGDRSAKKEEKKMKKICYVHETISKSEQTHV